MKTFKTNDTAKHASLGHVIVQYDYGTGVCVRKADRGYCVRHSELVRS
jgi:hypothetical protein